MSTVEVSQQIEAFSDQVGHLVGDPVAMGGIAAECAAMEWVGSPAAPGVVVRFRGQNRSGWRRWTTTSPPVRDPRD
ncbi:MAG TPA: hypothetical protein VHW93_05740, partial [Acidimicrobiales bacterium]|nr:hypothetical protein [Acidimicrobiales bacterium]